MNTTQTPDSGRDAKGIARALRQHLGAIGIDITHSAALELVAKTALVKDWNVLAAHSAASPSAAPAPTKGLFCPHCGKQGSVTVVSTAFVEQGPGVEDEYLYEGDADHYECASCGSQFLDWQSGWASYSKMEGYVLMVERDYAKWTARLYPAGPVCAVMHERAEDLRQAIELSSASTPAEVVKVINEQALQPEANQNLIGWLGAYGVSAHWQYNGDTLGDAVKNLLKHLPATVDEAVLNREIGIF